MIRLLLVLLLLCTAGTQLKVLLILSVMFRQRKLFSRTCWGGAVVSPHLNQPDRPSASSSHSHTVHLIAQVKHTALLIYDVKYTSLNTHSLVLLLCLLMLNLPLLTSPQRPAAQVEKLQIFLLIRSQYAGLPTQSDRERNLLLNIKYQPVYGLYERGLFVSDHKTDT